MKTNVTKDDLDEQSTKSEVPPKSVSRIHPFGHVSFSCCGCVIAVPLLLIFSFLVLVLIIDPSAFHPSRWRAKFVEVHEIPNIMQELAGEWVIELPSRSPIFNDGLKEFNGGMQDWQKTRFVLNDDGTCVIHNLPVGMATSRLYPDDYLLKRQSEWAGKMFTGTWASATQSVSGGVNGEFAAIIIHGDKDDTVEDEYNYFSGILFVWKVKETYRLRLFDGQDDFIMNKNGIILKRVE